MLLFNDSVNCWDYVLSLADERMIIENWWNYAAGKLKCWEKILSQYHFVLPKSHMERPGIKPGPCGVRLVLY